MDHSRAYVAQYYVSWQELSYDSQGKEVLTARSWERNGQDLTARFRASIPLKGNVRNLSIWGTTLYPQIEDKVKND